MGNVIGSDKKPDKKLQKATKKAAKKAAKKAPKKAIHESHLEHTLPACGNDTSCKDCDCVTGKSGHICNSVAVMPKSQAGNFRYCKNLSAGGSGCAVSRSGDWTKCSKYEDVKTQPAGVCMLEKDGTYCSHKGLCWKNKCIEETNTNYKWAMMALNTSRTHQEGFGVNFSSNDERKFDSYNQAGYMTQTLGHWRSQGTFMIDF